MLFLFTFQSGDIQIALNEQSPDVEEIFTFQSGDIQICYSFRAYLPTIFIYIPIW